MSNFDIRIISSKDKTHALIAAHSELLDCVISEELLKMGFVCHDISGEWHEATSMWNFYCRVEPAINVTVGSYLIKTLGIDEYSVTDTRLNKQRTLCGGDLETLFRVLFI